MLLEVVRESILCASELEGGDLLFYSFSLLFVKSFGRTEAHRSKSCQCMAMSAFMEISAGDGPSACQDGPLLGQARESGGGNTRKKRKLLDKIVGRGLAAAAEWAVANVPSQPRDLLQHWGYTGEDSGSDSFAFVNWVLRFSASILTA